eukprot:jgi/Chlat1/7754/Chrsp66S00569
MAWTNFIVTAAVVGAAVMLLRTDIRQSAGMLRRNVRSIRGWLEEEEASAAARRMKDAEQPKHIEHGRQGTDAADKKPHDH